MLKVFAGLIKKVIKAGRKVYNCSVYANSDYFTVRHGTINTYTLTSPTEVSWQGNYRACDWSRWIMHWLTTAGGMRVVNDYCTRNNQEPRKVVAALLNRSGAAYKGDRSQLKFIIDAFLSWYRSQNNKYAISIDWSDKNMISFTLTNQLGDEATMSISQSRVPKTALKCLSELIGFLHNQYIHDVHFQKEDNVRYRPLEEIVSVLSQSFYDENLSVTKDDQQGLVFVGDSLTFVVEPKLSI